MGNVAILGVKGGHKGCPYDGKARERISCGVRGYDDRGPVLRRREGIERADAD
jgi:hypothetical protein